MNAKSRIKKTMGKHRKAKIIFKQWKSVFETKVCIANAWKLHVAEQNAQTNVGHEITSLYASSIILINK